MLSFPGKTILGAIIIFIIVPFFYSGTFAQNKSYFIIHPTCSEPPGFGKNIGGFQLINYNVTNNNNVTKLYLGSFVIPAKAGIQSVNNEITYDNNFAKLFFINKNVFSVSDTTKKDSVISRKPSSNKFIMKKSPWGAVLRSALIPGLGQFYNKDYWKIPVILGLMGYLGYEVVNNHNKYSDYRSQYANSQSNSNPEGDGNLKLLRNFYRDQRDEFIWYSAIVYFINLVDAYVGAHLFDFDVKQEITTNNLITSPKYTLTIKLPLGNF